MSDLDDLVASLAKGDPEERLSKATLTMLAAAAIQDGFVKTHKYGYREDTVEARFVIEGFEPEGTDD